MLAAVLADQVASPQTETQTVEQLKAARAENRTTALRRCLRRSRKSSCTKSWTITIAPRWTNPRPCWAMYRRARRRAPPADAKTRRVAQAPGEPLASHQRPQRSHGHLRFHMDVARTKRRASPKLIPIVGTASRSLSLDSSRGRNDLLLAVQSVRRRRLINIEEALNSGRLFPHSTDCHGVPTQFRSVHFEVQTLKTDPPATRFRAHRVHDLVPT